MWGYKKLQEAQKAYKKNRKNSGDLYFFRRLKIVYLVGTPKISAGGRRMVNMVNS